MFVHMTNDSYLILSDYLESHESDIANSENDFGELSEVFEEVFDRPAAKNVTYVT